MAKGKDWPKFQEISTLQYDFDITALRSTPSRKPVLSLAGKSLQPCLCSAQNQGMNIVSPLIGVYRFQVHNMPDDVEFI